MKVISVILPKMAKKGEGIEKREKVLDKLKGMIEIENLGGSHFKITHDAKKFSAETQVASEIPEMTPPSGYPGAFTIPQHIVIPPVSSDEPDNDKPRKYKVFLKPFLKILKCLDKF
jgi:hypothetical protein